MLNSVMEFFLNLVVDTSKVKLSPSQKVICLIFMLFMFSFILYLSYLPFKISGQL